MSLLLIIAIQAAFYTLLGLGYVLIYRATRVLNLAHGDVMVFGAFIFFQGWSHRVAAWWWQRSPRLPAPHSWAD